MDGAYLSMAGIPGTTSPQFMLLAVLDSNGSILHPFARLRLNFRAEKFEPRSLALDILVECRSQFADRRIFATLLICSIYQSILQWDDFVVLTLL